MTRDDWENHVATWQKTGMLCSEYCRVHDLDETQFALWSHSLSLHQQHWYLHVIMCRESPLDEGEYCRREQLVEAVFHHWALRYDQFHEKLCAHLLDEVSYTPGMVMGVALMYRSFDGLEDPSSERSRLRVFLERIELPENILDTPSQCMPFLQVGRNWKEFIMYYIRPPKPREDEPE